MRRHRSAGYHGDNLPGPGDFSEPDPPELADTYLRLAEEQLIAECDDDSPPSEEQINALAWELQDKACKAAESDAAENRYFDKLDRYED